MNPSTEVAELQRRVEDLQQQLRQAQKLTTVGELASSITHEFNNVLTTVINYAKLGLRHKDAASRDKAFDKILAAGQRASRITTGLLAYARRGADRRELTDLASLVRDLVILVEKDLEHHRVRLELQIDPQPVMSEVNAGQIQQVLLNLLINARQAMATGGVLTVVVRGDQRTRQVELAVRDTGTGIAPESLARLFQPFFTTKQSDEKGQGGNGLGLSFCKEVVESHQGRIEVQSQLGMGTVFTVRLPLASSEAALSPAAAVLQRRARAATAKAG